ncbi:hypothetical protein D3C71_1438820 [compost metagenome]
MARAAVSQRRQHRQRPFGTTLVQQHVSRYRGRGFHQTGIDTRLFLRGAQKAIAPVEFTQAMRCAPCRQGGQNAARLHLGLLKQLGQILFGVRVAAFQQADPAAFEQFVVARLGALAAPRPHTIGNGQQPGQQAQAHIQSDEGRHDQQDGERQRHSDAPRPHQQQHVAGMRTQHHRQGDGDDGEQQCPEPGTHMP